MESLSIEGLGHLLRKINREMAAVEARLQRMASRLGVAQWRELEDLFKSQGLDNPELDILWPEYVYLTSRLKELQKRKTEILAALEGKSS